MLLGLNRFDLDLTIESVLVLMKSDASFDDVDEDDDELDDADLSVCLIG